MVNSVRLDLNYDKEKQSEQQDDKTKISQTSTKTFENLENATDPFVVYKYELNDEESIELDSPAATKACVLLSLNEKFLIEKDESNTNLLNLNEFSELTDIRLADDEYVKKRIV